MISLAMGHYNVRRAAHITMITCTCKTQSTEEKKKGRGVQNRGKRTVGKVVEQVVHDEVRLDPLDGMVVVVQPRLVPLPNFGRVLDARIVKELAPDSKGAVALAWVWVWLLLGSRF